MASLRYTRNLFLRSLCIVYLFAFISFYIQIPGLYGDNGILPAKSLLENSKHKTLSAKVHYQPTLLWLAPYLGLDTNYALDVLALLGSFLAFTGFISQKFCTVPLYAGLWSLYFSLNQIGQVFVSNNYDDFLLEAGFLALLVAPFLPGRRRGPKVSFWLVKWLLFRFLLTCGLSKFISGCPKWWSLTAFDYYFETQPLPTPLAWYFHVIPNWYLRLFGIVANVWEIVLPLFFFVPIRTVRISAFVLQMFLQISIVLTGNYNFANLLLVTLQLSLLDDQFFFIRKKPTSNWTYLGKLLSIILYGLLIYGVIKLYNLRINGSVIESNIAFTKDQFDYVLKQGLTLITILGLISLGVEIVKSITLSLNETGGVGSKILVFTSTVFYSGIALLIFFGSTVPLSSLHSASNSTVHPTVRNVYNRLNKLHAINQYGLFKKMAGVDGRHEIILEGSNTLEGPWLEYNFLYKPGNVNHSLPFVAPYSPRVDWQMFWAAYSTYDKQPWLLSLAHRLLLGQPEVLSLLDKHHSPFTQKPPKFIRASLYKYKYVTWNERSSSSWWKREKIREYFPAYTKDSPALVDYLKARNLMPTPSKQTVNPILKQGLDSIRYVTGHLEATLLSWSVFTAGCAIMTTAAKK